MSNNFIFLGDSLTFGYGVRKSDCWVNKLSNNNDINNLTIINKGVNGSTTTDMLVRFDKDVLSYTPEKVFIMAGTNDLLCNRNIPFIVENIELMIKDLTAKKIDILIGLPPDIIIEDAYQLFIESRTYAYCKQSLPILREKLISLCNKYECTYVDFYSITNTNINNNIYLDGIHLNPSGQNLMYNEFINTYSH